MPYQSELLILSLALVIILVCLLIVRIVRERKQMATIQRMSTADFSEFLRSNSVEGTIQVVAGRVSEFLKNAFGCEKIVFLRKQRGYLELNYYHGIRGFGRSEFRIRFGKQLLARLQQDALPRPLDDIEDLLTEVCLSKLRQYGMDSFFPVFWRDNLYGIYFIKSTMETNTAAFMLLISGLAHSLSAAYHIKWHESRFERLQKKAQDLPPAKPSGKGVSGSTQQILKLVRHRNSESIIPKIVESMQEELGLPSVAFLYESKKRGATPMLWKNGVNGSIGTPQRPEFDQLVGQFTQTEIKQLDDLVVDGSPVNSLSRQLKDAGLKYVTKMLLTSRRNGLLSWAGGEPPQVIAQALETFRMHTRDLVENAESYERVEEMSYTDGLTGLANQRYFQKRLKEEIDRAKRYRRSMALIIFDLDDLKSINDNYGHLAGDAVLKRLGQILRSSIRAIDVIARYGGDEFCAIMPEADGATCERFMRRLQEKISSSRFSIKEIEGELNHTISQGGAVFPDHGDSYDSLMRAADSALLGAKDAGRNRYFLFDPRNLTSQI